MGSIPQQFSGYSFLSPLYNQHQFDYTRHQTGYHGTEYPDEENQVHNNGKHQNLYKQTGDHSTESQDKESYLVPSLSSSLSPSSSGYGSSFETPQQYDTQMSASPDPDDHGFVSYDFIALRLNRQDDTKRISSQEDATAGEVHRNSKDQPLSSSVSPEGSSSTGSPPGSTTSSSSPPRNTTPISDGHKPPKKNTRTAYTNEQIQTLLKIFHLNPYPESEYMERIAMEFGVAENKIKIWFQNKRARWCRRVNNNNAGACHQQFLPTMPPMISPVTQYGYMPHGQFMTSSPSMVSGYLNSPMQSPVSANSSMDNLSPRFQTTHTPMTSYQTHMTSTSYQAPMTSTSYQRMMSSIPYFSPSSLMPLSVQNSLPTYHTGKINDAHTMVLS